MTPNTSLQRTAALRASAAELMIRSADTGGCVARQTVVNTIPMDVIWDEQGRVLDARRVEYLGSEQIRERLRSGPVLFLIADIGTDLQRLAGRDAFAFWKVEARERLVSPEQFSAGFRLEEYPGEYCYVCSAWVGVDLPTPVVLFERHH